MKRVHSRGQYPRNFIETKGSVNIKEKSSSPTGLVWYTNAAAISLFWNRNMAAMTSCENVL